MTTPPERIDQIRQWVRKAEHDLTAARHTMTIVDQGLTDIICYHCQQCAEKYMKALLLLHQVHFPKTHDLRLLLDLIHKHTPLKMDPRDVLPLNRYAIEGRYPGDWEEVEPPEAIEAVKLTQAIRDQVRQELSEETLDLNF